MKPCLTVNVNLEGRPAIYTPIVNRAKYNVEAYKQYEVEVLGLYQVAVDVDVDAYFVIAFPNGQCTYAGVEQIQFIKETEEATE